MTDNLRYCLIKNLLGVMFTIDDAFLNEHLQRGSTLVSRHATLTEAGSACCRLQLEESSRVRDDAAALGGKLLIARIHAITIRSDEEARRYWLHLITSSGGSLLQVFPLTELHTLAWMLRQLVDLNQIGDHMLPQPILVTLRLVDDPIRRDAQVARWSVIGVGQVPTLPSSQIQRLEQQLVRASAQMPSVQLATLE